MSWERSGDQILVTSRELGWESALDSPSADPCICLAKHVTDGVAHVLAIRLVQPSGAAAALGEEHEIHDQKRNRPSDRVDREPLLPAPTVSGGPLLGHDAPPIQSESGYLLLSVYYGSVDGAGSTSHRGAPLTFV